MNKTIAFLYLILVANFAFADVHYIDISKITSDSKLVDAFTFVKDNTPYYEVWTNQWNYDIPKDQLIKKLHGIYEEFSALPKKNEELYLLLGDIAHYLYNMDDQPSYELAVSNYEQAINANPDDYRAYWFLGYHYGLANVPKLAFVNFNKARKLLPEDQPADFWNNYAWESSIANMPEHSIYAMDKVRSITGQEGTFEQQLGSAVRKQIVPVDKDSTYKWKNLWTYDKGDMISFTSLPLGIEVSVDSMWHLSIYDYNNHQSGFVITPPAIANSKGTDITYTIGIIMKTPGKNEKLADFVKKVTSQYRDNKEITFSTKYDKMIAYESRDSTIYPNIGGGHFYTIGIERDEPKYPGLHFETPASAPMKSGELSYFKAPEHRERFKGRIFYIIMLDTCEDIFSQSSSLFKSLFDNQIIIE